MLPVIVWQQLVHCPVWEPWNWGVFAPQELAGYTGGDASFLKEDFELQLNRRLFWDSVRHQSDRVNFNLLQKAAPKILVRRFDTLSASVQMDSADAVLAYCVYIKEPPEGS